MSDFNAKNRFCNVSLLMINTRDELVELISSGFFYLQPWWRLVYVEEENLWLDVHKIRDGLIELKFMDAGQPYDYV